ncbi:hypothetical protein [Jiangella alkaliphila]|uniref:Uncharacterized protein n=1 Tax=Jiangella alkaliphila TaxID=419479 RepID=A0A1H2IE54_9ACTN|nr:hypothetical protein [Jiangella alkaliphila]SDU42206.1 hypothetical protein SAMN04488563_1633 [Jiangella alkaliphila]
MSAGTRYKRPRRRPITGLTVLTVQGEGGDRLTHEQAIDTHPVTGKTTQLGHCCYCGGCWPCSTVRVYAGPEAP